MVSIWHLDVFFDFLISLKYKNNIHWRSGCMGPFQISTSQNPTNFMLDWVLLLNSFQFYYNSKLSASYIKYPFLIPISCTRDPYSVTTQIHHLSLYIPNSITNSEFQPISLVLTIVASFYQLYVWFPLNQSFSVIQGPSQTNSRFSIIL